MKVAIYVIVNLKVAAIVDKVIKSHPYDKKHIIEFLQDCDVNRQVTSTVIWRAYSHLLNFCDDVVMIKLNQCKKGISNFFQNRLFATNL